MIFCYTLAMTSNYLAASTVSVLFTYYFQRLLVGFSACKTTQAYIQNISVRFFLISLSIPANIYPIFVAYFTSASQNVFLRCYLQRTQYYIKAGDVINRPFCQTQEHGAIVAECPFRLPISLKSQTLRHVLLVAILFTNVFYGFAQELARKCYIQSNNAWFTKKG